MGIQDCCYFIGADTAGGTAGSVLFLGASTQLAQNNAEFFWDVTNARLGLGTTSPSSKLHIVETTEQARFGYDSSHYLSVEAGSTGITTLMPNGATLKTLTINSLPAPVATINHILFGVTKQVTANSSNYAAQVVQLELAHTDDSSSTVRGLHVQTGVATGNAFNAAGLSAYSAQIAHLGSGTIVSAVGMEILSPINTGGGAITTAYGLYVASQATGGTGYGVYQAGTFDSNYFAGATVFNAGITAPFVIGGSSAGTTLFLTSSSHATKGLIKFGTASAYDEVNARLGIGNIAPAAALHVIKTTEQSRLGYNTSNYFSTTLDASGNTTFALTGTSPAFIFSNPIGIGRDPSVYILDVYNASATSFMNIETGNASSNASIRLGNPGRKWVMGVRGDITGDAFAFADQTASQIRFVIDSSGNLGVGATTVSARVHAVSTSEQLRVGYDVNNYFSTTVSSVGGVTFNAVSSGSGARFTFADVVNIPTATPASAAATGTTGDIAWDSGFVYVCTGTNTWKRVAIATW